MEKQKIQIKEDFLPDEKQLNNLFSETPAFTSSAITSMIQTHNRITLRLNRYFIRPIETKKMWLKYRFRLHSFAIDLLNNEAVLEFKRCV